MATEEFIDNVNVSTEGSYYIRARSHFLTYSNLTKLENVSTDDILLDCERIFDTLFFSDTKFLAGAFCLEKHENGVPHVHLLLQFKDDKCITVNPRIYIFEQRPRLERTFNVQKALDYIKKDGKFKIFGDFDFTVKIKRAVNRAAPKWKPKPTCVEDIPEEKRENNKANTEFLLSKRPEESLKEGIISLNQYCSLKKAYDNYHLFDDYKDIIRDVTVVWIYGPPGIGKTQRVFKQYPRVYTKLPNQWWDGYNKHETVLLDEFDHPNLLAELKKWTDVYPLRTEVKCGFIQPNEFKLFFICSNKHPIQIWDPSSFSSGKHNLDAYNALVRRMHIKTVVGIDRLVTYTWPNDPPTVIVKTLAEAEQYRGKNYWVRFDIPRNAMPDDPVEP